MQADTGKMVHEVAGSKPPLSPGARHVLHGTSALLVYQPIFTINTLTVLDVAERRVLHQLPPQEGVVIAVGVARNGETVVSITAAGNLLVWDPVAAREVATRKVPENVQAVAVDALGRHAAIVAAGVVRVVELAATQE